MKYSSVHTARPILLLVTLLMAFSGFTQGKFTVNGRLKIEGGDVAGSRAVLYKNGEKERTISSNLNKFSLDLDLNANYVISFEKDGYVAKKISFNTKVPGDAAGSSFTPFDFAVSLFKQYDDINIVVFNQPVGVIRYETTTGDFDYDTDYTKSIQSQLQQVLAQVQEKQKEEARNAEAEAKRKVEEEKQKAKTEAEAKKQADANAKAETARAEATRKEQEQRDAEARKAEAERQRAEQERLAQEQRKPTPAVPVVKEEPKVVPVAKQESPAPKALAKVEQHNSISAKAQEGTHERRTLAPVMGEETSRVAQARTNKGEESKPPIEEEKKEVLRNEELVVEANKVMAVIKLETNGVATEYRKVTHKWGGTFYFKNGATCTREVYETEAQIEQLAGATPRSKLD